MDYTFLKHDINNPFTITDTHIFKQGYCVLTCLHKRQQSTRNKEMMLVSHTVRRGNMTILAINMTMYDVDSRK